jgi:hypothetical protein
VLVAGSGVTEKRSLVDVKPAMYSHRSGAVVEI